MLAGDCLHCPCLSWPPAQGITDDAHALHATHPLATAFIGTGALLPARMLILRDNFRGLVKETAATGLQVQTAGVTSGLASPLSKDPVLVAGISKQIGALKCSVQLSTTFKTCCAVHLNQYCACPIIARPVLAGSLAAPYPAATLSGDPLDLDAHTLSLTHTGVTPPVFAT